MLKKAPFKSGEKSKSAKFKKHMMKNKQFKVYIKEGASGYSNVHKNAAAKTMIAGMYESLTQDKRRNKMPML